MLVKLHARLPVNMPMKLYLSEFPQFRFAPFPTLRALCIGFLVHIVCIPFLCIVHCHLVLALAPPIISADGIPIYICHSPFDDGSSAPAPAPIDTTLFYSIRNLAPTASLPFALLLIGAVAVFTLSQCTQAHLSPPAPPPRAT